MEGSCTAVDLKIADLLILWRHTAVASATSLEEVGQGSVRVTKHGMDPMHLV